MTDNLLSYCHILLKQKPVDSPKRALSNFFWAQLDQRNNFIEKTTKSFDLIESNQVSLLFYLYLDF